jgi:hypothetical protein
MSHLLAHRAAAHGESQSEAHHAGFADDQLTNHTEVNNIPAQFRVVHFFQCSKNVSFRW